MKLRTKNSARARALLRTPIRDLGLKLTGSPVERMIRRLEHELELKRVQRFQPAFYLTDEWGCPSGQPVIGVPFYLAHRELANIEKRTNGLETPREIMMYLRHEAGHAFNYAYRLYRRRDWRDTFGPYRRPYHDEYRPVPFSRDYVRHLPGWYAQKHPDEDFAETFAVWLTPQLDWRRRYRGWACIEKLQLVDRLVRASSRREPVVKRGRPDITTDQMRATVGEYFERVAARSRAAFKSAFDHELRDIFLAAGSRRRPTRPAAEIVEGHEVALTNTITSWTGVGRPVVRGIVQSIADACRERGLRGMRGKEKDYLVHLTAYATALAIHYLARGKYHKV